MGRADHVHGRIPVRPGDLQRPARRHDFQGLLAPAEFSGDGGHAETLMYGSLFDAMAFAARQDEAVQDGLWIATSNDVIAWRDLVND